MLLNDPKVVTVAAAVHESANGVDELVGLGTGVELGGLVKYGVILDAEFFAYLEVGETSGSTFDMPDSSLWTLYQRLRADGAALSMRKVSDRSQIFPVFHDLFQRRRKQEKAAP